MRCIQSKLRHLNVNPVGVDDLLDVNIERKGWSEDDTDVLHLGDKEKDE